ncbi:MAG: MFS transporter [Thermomicrobiales bacterium]
MITTTRVRERAQGVFYGWWVVSGAFAIQVLLSALLMQSFGAYVPVLQDQFGWSKAQLSAAFSLQRVESGLLGPIQGWMLDRFGPRNVMRVGMLLFGIGLMLFSQINSLTYFYLVFLLIAVGGSLGGFMSLTSTLVNWFVRKRATAMGVAQMGMSVGGLLVPLVAISLTDLGWRSTAFYSGIIVLVVGLPVTQLMRRNPEEYGLLPDGETEEEAAERRARARAEQIESDDIEFTPKQAMRTRAFWFISLGHGAAVLVVSAVMVHLIVHLNEGLGYSLRAAATVVSLMTIMQMIGLPVGGYLGDRFEKRKIAIFAMFGHASALIVLAYATNLAMVIFFAVVHGLAWGMRGPLMQAMRADYFGRKAFAKVMGFSSMIVMIGMTSGPLVAGILADRLGNYQLGFTVLGVAAGLGSVFFIFATKPTPPSPQPIGTTLPGNLDLSPAD